MSAPSIFVVKTSQQGGGNRVGGNYLNVPRISELRRPSQPLIGVYKRSALDTLHEQSSTIDRHWSSSIQLSPRSEMNTREDGDDEDVFEQFRNVSLHGGVHSRRQSKTSTNPPDVPAPGSQLLVPDSQFSGWSSGQDNSRPAIRRHGSAKVRRIPADLPKSPNNEDQLRPRTYSCPWKGDGPPQRSRSVIEPMTTIYSAGEPSEMATADDPGKGELAGGVNDMEIYYRLRRFKTTRDGHICDEGESYRRARYDSSSRQSPAACKSHPDSNVGSPPRVTINTNNETVDDAASGQSDDHSAYAQLRQTLVQGGRAPYKVLVAGPTDVGKHAIVQQFLSSELITDPPDDMEEWDETLVSVLLDGRESHVDVICLPRDVNLAAQIKSRRYDGFIIVYSITDRSTFSQAELFLGEIYENLGDQIACYLVGNKVDLERQRVVSRQEGKRVAKVYGCKFLETSAAIHHQIDDLLVGLLQQMKWSESKRKLHVLKTRERARVPKSGLIGRVFHASFRRSNKDKQDKG